MQVLVQINLANDNRTTVLLDLQDKENCFTILVLCAVARFPGKMVSDFKGDVTMYLCPYVALRTLETAFLVHKL